MISIFIFDFLNGIWIVLQIYLLGFYSVILEFINDRIKQSNDAYIKKLDRIALLSEFNQSRKKRIAIVTGGGGAIGSEIVLKLLSMRYKVIAISKEPGLLKDKLNENLIHYSVDFSNSKELKRISSKVLNDCKKIDLIFCCAGAMLLPYKLFRYKNELIEGHMAINLFSHAILINDLLELLQQPNHNSRIIFISSSTLRIGNVNKDLFSYYLNGYQAYADSKLAMAIYASSLQKALQANNNQIDITGDSEVKCREIQSLNEGENRGETLICSLHPGCVFSALYERVNIFPKMIIFKLFSFFMRSKETAASEILATAMNDSLNAGAYYEYMNEVDLPVPLATQRRLYKSLLNIIK